MAVLARAVAKAGKPALRGDALAGADLAAAAARAAARLVEIDLAEAPDDGRLARAEAAAARAAGARLNRRRCAAPPRRVRLRTRAAQRGGGACRSPACDARALASAGRGRRRPGAASRRGDGVGRRGAGLRLAVRALRARPLRRARRRGRLRHPQRRRCPPPRRPHGAAGHRLLDHDRAARRARARDTGRPRGRERRRRLRRRRLAARRRAAARAQRAAVAAPPAARRRRWSSRRPGSRSPSLALGASALAFPGVVPAVPATGDAPPTPCSPVAWRCSG